MLPYCSQTVVIDARAHMLGRLASIVAKQILSGYKVVSAPSPQLGKISTWKWRAVADECISGQHAGQASMEARLSAGGQAQLLAHHAAWGAAIAQQCNGLCQPYRHGSRPGRRAASATASLAPLAASMHRPSPAEPHAPPRAPY